MEDCVFDPQDVLLQEVSLEGLDGITLSALWLRLETCSTIKHPPLDDYWKCFYFNLLKNHPSIASFELPEERGELFLFDFKDHVNPSNHSYIEPDKIPPDLYPYYAIQDEEEGIMGSCCAYRTRRDITSEVRNFTFEEAWKTYGNRLVFVASQQLRTKFLVMTKGQFLPTLHGEVSLHSYCILERIGRCRQYGCLDISKEGIRLAPKDIFYHRKKILCSKWITRQFICKKKKKGIMRFAVYYLHRYHVEHKSKLTTIMQKILESLKAAVDTDHVLPISSFQYAFDSVTSLSVKRLVVFFQLEDIIKDVELPYSQVYPNLSRSQCLNTKKEEKLAPCVKLLDPNINIEKELSKDIETTGDDGSDDEEDKDTQDELEEEVNNESLMQTSLAESFNYVEPVSDLSDNESFSLPYPGKTNTYESTLSIKEIVEETLQVSCLQKKGFLMDKELPIDLSIKKQFLRMVEDAGPAGVSGLEVKKQLQLNRIDSRNLQKHCGYVDSYSKDEGRQRRLYFRLKRYKGSSIYENSNDSIPCKIMKLELPDSDVISELSSDTTVGTADQIEKRKRFAKECVSDLQRCRANDLLEFINTKQYSIFYPICNYLIEKDKERCISKCDRKTIRRLLDKLAEFQCIKIADINVKVSLVSDDVKTIRIFANADFDTDSEEFREKIRLEQMSKLNNQINVSYTQFVQKMELLNTEFDTKIKTESLENGEENDVIYKGPQEKDLSQVEEYKICDNMSVEIHSIKQKSTKNSIIALDKLYPTAIMNNRVLDCYQHIMENRVVIGSSSIQRFITERDKDRNYNVIIDHRTIRRMVEKMSLNNHINCFRIKLKNLENSTEKEFYISTTLDVSVNSPEMCEVLNKEKLLFISQNIPAPPPDGSTKALRQQGEYTILAKFGKMEKMHRLVFHVTYSQAEPLEDQQLARSNLEQNFHVQLADDHPPIYNYSDLNDFTFLPSLSPPPSYPRGFIKFNDFFALIPLKSMMESMGRDSFPPSLDQMYRDPVRRFYPIKYTDANVFSVLTRQSFGRKNVSSIYNVFQNLATIGLTQFGQRLGAEKEYFIMYVNQKVSLRDTTSASPSYLELDPDTMKPITTFTLQSASDVRRYWLDTTRICANTPLGIRTFAIGQKVMSYKRVCDKPALAECCKHVDDVELVLSRDNYQVPGDGLGAAGYDSLLFAHIKKNWFSINKKVKTESPVANLKKTRDVTKKIKSMLAKKNVSKVAKEKPFLGIERTVMKRNNAKKKIFKEKVISEAIRRNFRSQISWSTADSDVLHLTHILYKIFRLKPCNRLTRDILVRMLNKRVLNKKSKALNTISSKVLLSHYRRVMKFPENRDRCSLLEAEVHHRPEVRAFLFPHLTKHRKLCMASESKVEAHRYICDHFLSIVQSIYEIILDQQLLHNDFPSTYKEYIDEYTSVVSTESLTDIYPIPSTPSDMELNVVFNLIYSSLASGFYMNNEAMSIMLFDAYQRFSETLIQKAIKLLRRLQVIASSRYINKLNLRAGFTKTQITTPLPLTRFKFSLRYLIRIKPIEMKCSAFYESYISFRDLSMSPEVTHDITNMDGIYFNILLILLDGDVQLDIETPESLLLFDPNTETVHKHVVDRYNELVEEFKQGIPLKKVLEDEDEDDDEPAPPMNMFNAARLAMYNLRDVLIKDHISIQHVHKLLTLNSCKILLSKVPPLLTQYDGSKKNAYVRKLRDRTTVPRLNQEQVNALVSAGIEKEVEQFIDKKEHVGATSEDIRVKFGANRKVKSALNRLVAKHVIIETGNVLVTYVHNKFCAPWLLRVNDEARDKASREILISPWVHLDGEINRKTLDYMLCLVLNYIICTPGVSLLTLQENFATVLQSVHVVQLVEMLVQFQCVQAETLTLVAPTIFTEGSVKMSTATLLESSHLIYIEAVSDAVLILGGYIATKTYAEDYFAEIVKSKNTSDNVEELKEDKADIDDVSDFDGNTNSP